MAHLPSLVTLDDLYQEVEDPAVHTSGRAQRAIDRASTLVRTHTGLSFVDENEELTDVPDAAFEVTLAAAARAWWNPKGVIQDTTGPFTVRYSEQQAEGVYLTDAEEKMLDTLRTKARLWTQSVEKDDPYLDEIRFDLGLGLSDEVLL
jgi:hypothetical protein